jgi:hypothetical protein
VGFNNFSSISFANWENNEQSTPPSGLFHENCRFFKLFQIPEIGGSLIQIFLQTTETQRFSKKTIQITAHNRLLPNWTVRWCLLVLLWPQGHITWQNQPSFGSL